MQENTVNKIISNFLVLRGHIRDAQIKISALEEILKEARGNHYERYRQLARQYESESKFAYPLEDIEGLRKALLQDHG